MIEEFAELIPKSLLDKSGEVFYSGRRAFGAPSELYILGANPGGTPEGMPDSTVSRHINQVLYDKPANWSAYRDESWHGRAPGKSLMQRGVLHLFKRLQLNPGEVPASELVFLRSKDLSRLEGDFNQLAEECWQFHQAVIDRLGVRVIACISNPASRWIRGKLGADTLLDEFQDTKPGWTRGWKSQIHKNADGIIVVRLSHPSRAIWTHPDSDPTTLVKRALIRSSGKYRRHYIAHHRNFKPVRIKGEMISDTVIKDREDRV